MEEALLNTSFIHRRAEVPSTWQCFLIKNSKGLQLTLGIRITSGNLKKKKHTKFGHLVPSSCLLSENGGGGMGVGERMGIHRSLAMDPS